MEKPKDHHYKFGIFYHHNDNPKIWVPKGDGLGWTLNFANKWSYVILFAFLAFVVAIIILAMNQKS